MAGFTQMSLDLLTGLEANNTKEWYETNKADFKAHLRDPFAAMLGVATALLEGSRYPLIGSEKTMFRQNRDVRFSKDKSLYKTHVSGLLSPSGDKKERGGVVYAQLGPRDGFLGAGFYQLDTASLNRVRDRIVANPDGFTEIADALANKGYALSQENALKTMPRGFQHHADAPYAAFLQLKRYVTGASQPPEVWLNGDIVERIVHLAEAIGPLNAWVRAALVARAE